MDEDGDGSISSEELLEGVLELKAANKVSQTLTLTPNPNPNPNPNTLTP